MNLSRDTNSKGEIGSPGSRVGALAQQSAGLDGRGGGHTLGGRAQPENVTSGCVATYHANEGGTSQAAHPESSPSDPASHRRRHVAAAANQPRTPDAREALNGFAGSARPSGRRRPLELNGGGRALQERTRP